MRIGTIIILIIVVWNIVAAILQASARKKQEQQMRDLSQRRKQQGATASASQTTTGSAGGEQSTREQLAARRKAQLEELRASRQASGQQAQQVSVDTRSQWPQPQSAEQSSTYTGAAQDVPSQQQLQQQRAGRRASGQSAQSSPTSQIRWPNQTRARGQQLEPVAMPPREHTSSQQAQQTPQARRVRQRGTQQDPGETPGRVPEVRAPRLGRTGVPIGETAVGTGQPYDAYRQRIPGSARARAIREQLMNPKQLREIFLLKEILDRPVTMRQNIDPYEPL